LPEPSSGRSFCGCSSPCRATDITRSTSDFIDLSRSASAEAKVWLDVPGVSTSLGLINVGADGSVTLPAGLDQRVPLSLGTVSPSFPRGLYNAGCRLLSPTTGAILSESINSFAIQ
jgi:hypothetical protein